MFFRFKDGEEITASSRYKTLYDEETEAASLVIKNLSLEDSGEYNIIAKNDVGTASQFVNLHVKGSPIILPTADNIQLGGSFLIQISVKNFSSSSKDHQEVGGFHWLNGQRIKINNTSECFS